MPKPTPLRTVRQIVQKDGTPAKAAATENLWVGYSEVFSNPSSGNAFTPFTTGADYFKDLIEQCSSAQKEIYITGWQVNWDAMLKPGVRLYDIVLEAARRKVKVFVMPWEHTMPVQTYDIQTKLVLESINEEKDVNAKLVTVVAAPSQAAVNASYFSHHQKCVVIDRQIAYMGGIDISYGRFDDAKFTLRADADGRHSMNCYNNGVPQLREIQAGDGILVDPDLFRDGYNKDMRDTNAIIDSKKMKWFRDLTGAKHQTTPAEATRESIKNGGWQVRYEDPWAVGVAINAKDTAADAPDPHTLDPSRQPRMPWQDMHCRVEGPVVGDLVANFVLRWNTNVPRNARLPMPTEVPANAGTCLAQLLRSAPVGMRIAERKACNAVSFAPKPLGLPKAVEAAKIGATTQDDIHKAMQLLIAKSRRFIYIENQFFVSGFGHVQGVPTELSGPAQLINQTDWSTLSPGTKIMAARKAAHGDKDALPNNKICEALGARINLAIMDAANPHFHVYITLPVHPEGSLADATVATQIHWTMQTLVFGTQSLLNRIRRSICARKLLDQKKEFDHVFLDADTTHHAIDIKECFNYVTLLNLRNWEQLGDRYVTEQIYIHNKLMIVDDCYALFGSANINDRSQLGDRDSELAMLVCDTKHSYADTAGKGSHRLIRSFAHGLRKNIWEKLFGITGGVRPADELATAIEQPGSPASWKAIQKRAAQNTALYDASFRWIPKNKDPNDPDQKLTASIWPIWDTGNKQKNGEMPFERSFWSTIQHEPNASASLKRIRGFITLFPIEWTSGENNDFKYPTQLVVKNDPMPGEKNQDILVASDNDLLPEELG